MHIKMGEKIRTLRKARNISQEVLAQYLGVSFQSVSKWETATALPDITLIPAIASFFEVSTDELFDFNTLENEKKVRELCEASWEHRQSDPARAELLLRSALKQYPGNDIILNNLLYTMRAPERNAEVVELCKTIAESTKLDDVRYDALRILAETYKSMGESALCKATIERIPEFYFSKLELDAELLEGEDMYRAAEAQKNLSAETLLNMLLRLADYYESVGESTRAAEQLVLARDIAALFKGDIPSSPDRKSFYEYYGREVEEKAAQRLEGMTEKSDGSFLR